VGLPPKVAQDDLKLTLSNLTESHSIALNLT
jgi:hypothetical protein